LSFSSTAVVFDISCSLKAPANPSGEKAKEPARCSFASTLQLVTFVSVEP
jgi:hypothetical protein